jgi:hypothetical protein
LRKQEKTGKQTGYNVSNKEPPSHRGFTDKTSQNFKMLPRELNNLRKISATREKSDNKKQEHSI